MNYCGPKIDFFHKQGTSYRIAMEKAEMLYIDMADKIKNLTSAMNGNWNDFHLLSLARLKRNKDILDAENNDEKIIKMLKEIEKHGILFVEFKGSPITTRSIKSYENELLDKYLHKN